MSTQLTALAVDYGKNFLYSPAYIAFIESHLKFLKEHERTIKIPLDKGMVYKNMYNFYGLLSDLSISTELFFVILRMNEFTHPNQLTLDTDNLLIPYTEVINSLKQRFITSLGVV